MSSNLPRKLEGMLDREPGTRYRTRIFDDDELDQLKFEERILTQLLDEVTARAKTREAFLAYQAKEATRTRAASRSEDPLVWFLDPGC